MIDPAGTEWLRYPKAAVSSSVPAAMLKQGRGISHSGGRQGACSNHAGVRD